MINDNTKTLEKMKIKHELELKKMNLQNQLDIEKDSLKTKLKLNKLQSSKSQIDSKREIFTLKNLVRKDNLTRKAGQILKFWAIVVTVISTLITIAGGLESYNQNIYSIVAFISAVIVLQFTVFIIASQETRIKQEFFSHKWKCTLLKYALLTVSIYNNYKFFKSDNSNSFITLLLCIALDLICIFLISLAYDQITLNAFKRANNKNKSLIYKAFCNMTYKYVDRINKQYADNKNLDYKLIENNNFGSDNITVEEITQKEDTSSLFPKFEAENKTYIGDKEKKISLKKGSSTFYPVENSKDDINIKIGGFMSNYKKPSKLDKIIDRQENKEDENINLKPEIFKYLDYMYNNLKGDFSPGKRDIKTNTELKYRTIDLIFEQLIQLNIISVEVVKNVKKTRVLKEKKEALSLINKHF